MWCLVWTVQYWGAVTTEYEALVRSGHRSNLEESNSIVNSSRIIPFRIFLQVCLWCSAPKYSNSVRCIAYTVTSTCYTACVESKWSCASIIPHAMVWRLIKQRISFAFYSFVLYAVVERVSKILFTGDEASGVWSASISRRCMLLYCHTL